MDEHPLLCAEGDAETLGHAQAPDARLEVCNNIFVETLVYNGSGITTKVS